MLFKRLFSKNCNIFYFRDLKKNHKRSYKDIVISPDEHLLSLFKHRWHSNNRLVSNTSIYPLLTLLQNIENGYSYKYVGIDRTLVLDSIRDVINIPNNMTRLDEIYLYDVRDDVCPKTGKINYRELPINSSYFRLCKLCATYKKNNVVKYDFNKKVYNN